MFSEDSRSDHDLPNIEATTNALCLQDTSFADSIVPECLPACQLAVQGRDPPAVIPEDNQYLVERILSHKISQPKGYKKKITQYLVKWEGYPDESNSLVVEIHEDLIKAYTATAQTILKQRSILIKRGKKMIIEYLVKWEGYADDQSIWINEDHVHEDLITAYGNKASTKLL